ncbi:LacI family DNA-binding transcriptional regulator [Acidobacterium sp. S8]|uniref:LacI family DNA-binding transcriptional regulator n=1 Tax=Acidobacterium sp. S8 TaxID=1641854 RepID=UPI001C20591E|nr:LacI family DNA-binding transcriptional regulator [Acidobacterium sp. S8]
MNDVARVAGVGTMTVSRVLNGSANVTEETAKRVYRAIEKLGYRPNEMARALRSFKSRTIGLIVPYLFDPFFATCAHAVNTVAREHNYSVILTTSNEDPVTEFNEAQSMLQRHVEGMLIIPADIRKSRVSQAEFAGTHIVTLDRPVHDARLDSVQVQNQSGAKRAVQHLIQQHDHKRILFLGFNRNLYTVRSRFEGYRRAMQESHLEPSATFDCSSEETTAEIIDNQLQGKNPPTAFFTANNLTTRYSLHALLEKGVRVPEEVALVGFDDFELADILHPTLTVVRQPASELGRVAANLLFDRIKRDEFPEEGSRIVLPVELVIRRSCGCKARHSTVIA